MTDHPQDLIDTVRVAVIDNWSNASNIAIAAITAVRAWDAQHAPDVSEETRVRGEVASVIVGAISDELTYGDDPGLDDHADAVADDVIRLVRLARMNLASPAAPDVPGWVDTVEIELQGADPAWPNGTRMQEGIGATVAAALAAALADDQPGEQP